VKLQDVGGFLAAEKLYGWDPEALFRFRESTSSYNIVT